MDEQLLCPSMSHAHLSRSIKRRSGRATRLHNRSLRAPCSIISLDTLTHGQSESTIGNELAKPTHRDNSFHSTGCGDGQGSSSASVLGHRGRKNLQNIGQSHLLVASEQGPARATLCRQHKTSSPTKSSGDQPGHHLVKPLTKSNITQRKMDGLSNVKSQTCFTDLMSGDRSSEYDSSSSNQTQKCAPYLPKAPEPIPLPFPLSDIRLSHCSSSRSCTAKEKLPKFLPLHKKSELSAEGKDIHAGKMSSREEQNSVFDDDEGFEPLNRSRVESSTSQDDKDWTSNFTGGDSDSDCSKPGGSARGSFRSSDSRAGFLLLRKRKGSRKKDRYSKSSLMKRASENFSEKGYIIGSSEKLRDEVAKFFRKKKGYSDDNESGDSMGDSKQEAGSKPSIYREARYFFRRRKGGTIRANKSGNSSFRKTRSLHRSTSESHSLGQTSIESLPSVISEPIDHHRSRFSKRESDSVEKEESIRNTIPPIDPPKPNILSRSQVIQLVQDLGFKTNKPLKLYISSMDALLVYNPFEDVAKCEPCLTLEAAASASASVASVEYLERERSFRVGHSSSGELSAFPSWSTQASSSSHITHDPSCSSMTMGASCSSIGSDFSYVRGTRSIENSVTLSGSSVQGGKSLSDDVYSEDDSTDDLANKSGSDVQLGSPKKGLGKRWTKTLRRDIGLKLLSQWKIRDDGKHERKSSKLMSMSSTPRVQGGRMKSVVEVDNECGGGNTSGRSSVSIDGNMDSLKILCGDDPHSARRSPIPEELLSEKPSSHLPSNTTIPSNMTGIAVAPSNGCETNLPTSYANAVTGGSTAVGSYSSCPTPAAVKATKSAFANIGGGSNSNLKNIGVHAESARPLPLNNAALMKIQQQNVHSSSTVSGSFQGSVSATCAASNDGFKGIFS